MSIKDQLLTKINHHHAVVAIVGLGYVGLPLAVAFAEHGFPVIGHRRGRPQSDIAEPRRHPTCRTSLRNGWPPLSPGATLRLKEHRPPAPSGRRPTTPHSNTATRRSSACPRRSTRPATRTCVSSSQPVSRWRTTSIPVCSSPWNPPPTPAPPRISCCRCSRTRPSASAWMSSASTWERTSSWLFRRSALTPATSNMSWRTRPRWSAASRRHVVKSRVALYGDGHRADRAGLLHAGGRDGQAAGKHLPRRQHRPGQRSGHHVRQAGPRRLGGDRRRGDQALRLHEVHSRPRCGRPLHPARPVLPVLED